VKAKAKTSLLRRRLGVENLSAITINEPVFQRRTCYFGDSTGLMEIGKLQKWLENDSLI